MYSALINKQSKLAVIGLGYVGLPIALEFGKKMAVIGLI
jgi:UDP-N-acetyl-D-glucosamine/UDP-N-acetyl-D-galactosamine dehydrogenase